MKLSSIFLLSIMLSGFSHAGVVNTIHVERRLAGESFGELILPVDLTGKGYISKEVWRSPSGISCAVLLFGSSDGTFECTSPERYKAQMALDCNAHTSKEKAVYMFFGMVGSEKEVGNFYVWCE